MHITPDNNPRRSAPGIAGALAEGRILILDGAMGTMLQCAGLGEADFSRGATAGRGRALKGDNECLNLTRPDVVRRIHDEYIAAGADIIETNTFSANSVAQAEYGCADLARDMALEGARIARRAADEALLKTGRRVFVAGSVGPTSKSLSMSPDVDDPSARALSFDDMAQAYAGQLRGLIEGGADVLMIETCYDALNTKAALYALRQLLDDPQLTADPAVKSRLAADGTFPVIISATVNDKSGRTLTGQTLEAFYTAVSHYPLTAFGLNCSFGADDMHPLLKDVAAFVRCPVSCHPNAGLPDGLGGYAETPAQMAAVARRMASDGLLNIIGGCCGTTPEYIRAIAEAVSGLPARRTPADATADGGRGPLAVSGLEAVHIDLKTRNFTNVGERTNVAGSRKFARTIAAGDYAEALRIAAGQIEGGADIIDVNVDDAMLDGTAEMAKFTRYISGEPAVARAALMIDSSHWDTVLAGLKNAQGKSIVNSISLKDGEEAFLAKAREISRLGAAMVVMAFDEEGQATTYRRKTEICARAYRLLTERAGIRPHDIIFDVNVLAVGTGIEGHARYAVDFIEAVRWIKANLPGALTSGGVSNLSFAFRGNNTVREAMHSVFLYHAVRAGLDMAIVNPSMLQIYDEIEPELLRCVEDVILDADPGATERLIGKAARIAEAKAAATEAAGGAAKTAPAAVSMTAATPKERLTEALVRGRADGLQPDLEACMARGGTAVSIIEGPLMDGMKKVGRLFGAGKMFLPQVVKSAKVMKEAVSLLQPYMEQGPATPSGAASPAAKGKPVVVIATVKGDVHDIGKNITSIVLGCNGFSVNDLGVMVDKETILDAAASGRADIIGVSGLITPSLYQMEELCREMARRAMDTPLLIGGATTSALHTAVKLAPLYGHVFYGADASATAVMAKRLTADREAFEREEHAAQERLRSLYAQGGRPVDTTDVAAEAAFAPADYLDRPAPEGTETIELGVGDVMPYFDWRAFNAAWGVKGLTAEAETDGAAELRRDAEAALGRLAGDKRHTIRITVRWLDAASCGDDIRLSTPDGGLTLPMLRQERPAKAADGTAARRSLADFAPPADYGFTSPVGLFAVCAGRGEPAAADYDGMIVQTVMNSLAEAASAWLDRKIRSDARLGDEWRIIKPAAGYPSCPDHTLKRDILALLGGADATGITLTESCAMQPEASICGLIFVHRHAAYPDIRRISPERLAGYARRRGMTDGEARRYLSHLLE